MGRLSLLAIVAIATIISLTSGPISAKKCGDKASSTAYRQVGLDAHNTYRAKHKDTPALTLDDKLSEGAQQCAQMLADTGKWGHICDKSGNGENLATGWGNSDSPPETLIKSAVDMWYREIANYSYATPNKPKGTVGHFTQVVWKDTQRLGLGLAINKKDDRWVIAGRYNPPGNYKGENGENVMPLK